MRRVLLLGCSMLFVACAMERRAASPAHSEKSAPPPAPEPSASAAPMGGDVAPAGATPPAMKAPAAAPGAGGGATGTVVMPSEIAAAQAQLDQASKAFAASGSDCLSLCKSLASMSNATEHLCGLVQGTTDEARCTDARARLQAAQAKVKTTCGNTCG